MAIYLKMDGIKGSVTNKQFQGQIEIETFRWGADVTVSSASGGDRTTSEPSVSVVSITKHADKASEGLFKQLLMGEAIAKSTLTFTAQSQGLTFAYSTIELSDVILSSFHQTSSGDYPNESIVLNFAKFIYSFTGRDNQQSGSAMRLAYDVTGNKLG